MVISEDTIQIPTTDEATNVIFQWQEILLHFMERLIASTCSTAAYRNIALIGRGKSGKSSVIELIKRTNTPESIYNYTN